MTHTAAEPAPVLAMYKADGMLQLTPLQHDDRQITTRQSNDRMMRRTFALAEAHGMLHMPFWAAPDSWASSKLVLTFTSHRMSFLALARAPAV